MSVSPIPEGYTSVTPYLIVPNALEAIEFYSKAFGAKQLTHMPGPGGQGTMHAEFQIGNASLMISDENPQWDMSGPKTLGGSPVNFMIYLDDCDAAFEKAVEAGCEAKCPCVDMFWGDRMGKVQDPFGYQWSVATHVEDVPEEEMGPRAQKWMEEMQQQA